MRLVDQTRVNPFYVRTNGEQPVVDGIASPLPVEVEATIMRRFSLAREHGELYPGAIAMSEDRVLVFAAHGPEGPQLVVVEPSGTRIMPFAVAGNPDEWAMELTADALIVTAGDRKTIFARPLVGPFAI